MRKQSLLIFCLFLFSLCASATEYTVNSLSDAGPGSLRQAILDGNSSGDNHVINFSVSGTISLSSNLPEMTKNYVINGEGIIIDGNAMYRAIFTGSQTISTINNLTIINCFGSQGGAILAGSGTLTLNNCLLDDNEASDDGGAILNRGTLNINRTTISKNTAGDDGGGIRTIGGNITIEESLLFMNSSSDDGGAIIINSNSNMEQGMVTLINTTVSGNMADDGGGIRIANGILIVKNSTIAFNEAVDDAGGIFLNSPSSLTISHSILANNTAGDDGPDMRSIVNPFNSDGNNIVGDVSNSNWFGAAGDQLNVDPLLNPLSDNGGPTMTHSLQEGSPALDASTGCEQIDQRGFYRTDGMCDIGAFEEGAAFAIPTLSQWGIILMGLVLLIIGLVFIRQRNAQILYVRA